MNRSSNETFEKINRLYYANMSGAANPDELGEILIDLGNSYSNIVSKGRVGENDINETLTIISCFKDDNNYFNRNHKNLSVAANTFIEGVYIAQERHRERIEASKPLFDAQTYESGFKKL